MLLLLLLLLLLVPLLRSLLRQRVESFSGGKHVSLLLNRGALSFHSANVTVYLTVLTSRLPYTHKFLVMYQFRPKIKCSGSKVRSSADRSNKWAPASLGILFVCFFLSGPVHFVVASN